MFVSVKFFKFEDLVLVLDQFVLEYCSEYFKNVNKDFSYGVLIMFKRFIFFICYVKYEVDVYVLIILLVIYIIYKLIV